MRMMNDKLRKVIDGFELIDDACKSGEEEREDHTQCESLPTYDSNLDKAYRLY
jgi:hypothetical protein